MYTYTIDFSHLRHMYTYTIDFSHLRHMFVGSITAITYILDCYLHSKYWLGTGKDTECVDREKFATKLGMIEYEICKDCD